MTAIIQDIYLRITLYRATYEWSMLISSAPWRHILRTRNSELKIGLDKSLYERLCVCAKPSQNVSPLRQSRSIHLDTYSIIHS